MHNFHPLLSTFYPSKKESFSNVKYTGFKEIKPLVEKKTEKIVKEKKTEKKKAGKKKKK